MALLSQGNVIVVEGLAIGPDYVFSSSLGRLKGGPYRRARKYLVKRDVDPKGGRVFCEIGGEEILGHWEVHHRGHENAHVAKFLGIACRTHNAGGHDRLGQGRASPLSPSLYAQSSKVDTDKASSTQADINAKLYPAYEKWLERETGASGKVLLEYAIYQAARQLRAVLGFGHYKTVQGYLRMLVTGPDAPYFVDGQYLCRRSAYEQEGTA
jgi:hypothetical protein